MKGSNWMRIFVWGLCIWAASGGRLAAQEWAQVQKVLLQKGSAMANNLAKSRKDLSRAYDALDAIAPYVHYASHDVLPWSFRVLPHQDNGLEQAAVLRNNRLELASRLLFEHAIRRLRAHRADIKAHLQYARSADLVSLIPAEAKFIFLGEVHHQPAIEKQILYILAHYRKKYPERKIMVLTEFVLDTDVSLLPREMDQRVTSKRAFFDLLMKK